MSPHFNSLKCRRLGTRPRTCRRAGTAAPYRTPKCPTRREPNAADGGAPARTSWEQLLWLEPMLGAPPIEPRRGPGRRTTTTQPGAPIRR
ncbi:hypothetical protein EVAR_64451_1 [Eumeta japonica]|uniref:Uncharacterized protein n=1 Tax=Eumeta variegata TaxID=151549 RepID=A0A4C1ZK10_EUMVA|nr:hypothetical protein EVAR_64451_1 [Eumeta japonica]